jgi:Flp pilus assembly protein TadD
MPSPEGPVIPAVLRLSANENRVMTAIRFLEDRVKRDPDDFIAYNKLAGCYLQRQRETGSLDYLALAARAAHASLSAMPAEQNVGGVAALAQVANSSHDFLGARDHALKLIQLDGSKGYPYQALGDALLELGDYDGAAWAYRSMEKRSRGAATEARMARLAMLTGHTETARRRMSNAVALCYRGTKSIARADAWCRWQLGRV